MWKRMTLKVLSLFSGYGTDNFALKELDVPHECIGYSDIDKYANQAFRQNHTPRQEYPDAMGNWEENKELGDVREINPNHLRDFDLLTGGTPCQDFSVAGCRRGLYDAEGNPTRSGLIFEFVRILKAKQPRYFLWENVKGVLSSKDKETGEYVIDFIMEMFSEAGYKVAIKLLNTKDYGIPQSRSRVWVVGIRKF